MYPPECTGAPLVAMLMSHSEHGDDEDGGGGAARCSPSGPQGPFFMIFLYLDLLFWNQIFTCVEKQKQETIIKNDHRHPAGEADILIK